MTEEDFPGVVLPKGSGRVRRRIRRYKDETGKEVYDRSTTHAVITVWPKNDPHAWPPVQIHFSIGKASGDFYVKDVIYEVAQWLLKPEQETKRYLPFREDGEHGDHEWWAARSMAIQAIETALRHEAKALAKHGGVQQSFFKR